MLQHTFNMERNIVLFLEYEGTGFHGWQSQLNAGTVQDAVAGAIRRLDGKPRRIIGASRTDAGVHARGQVANFFTDSRIPADKYAYALNTILPAGITCARSAEAPPQFHARYSAIGKEYSYTILNRRQPSALYRNRAWHVPLPQPLDTGAMRDAAELLIGEHDFRAFMSAGSPVKSTVRIVTRLEIVADMPDSLIKLSILGNGFLYNMVRIIAGTLVYVGQGKLEKGDVGRAILSGDRKLAGKTAPPHGLCLEFVEYGNTMAIACGNVNNLI